MDVSDPRGVRPSWKRRKKRRRRKIRWDTRDITGNPTVRKEKVRGGALVSADEDVRHQEGYIIYIIPSPAFKFTSVEKRNKKNMLVPAVR